MIEPWKGERWGDPANALGGFRLMILGESHHSNRLDHAIGSKPRDMTTGVVEAYIAGNLHPRSKAFFTKLAGLIAERPSCTLSSDDRADIWHSVAFYNYIPCIAAETPRNWPYRPEWAQDAELSFEHWRRILEVEAILVCGKRLWEWSGHWGQHPCEKTVRIYPVHGPYTAVAHWINHPSSGGWSPAKWASVFTALRHSAAEARLKHEHPTFIPSTDNLAAGSSPPQCLRPRRRSAHRQNH